MLKELENRVKIEGILEEIDLKTVTYAKDGKNRDAISGRIIVRVEQQINGEDKILSVPVHVFVNKQKNDGGLNPAYTNMEEVMTSWVSIAAGGMENADAVRITGAKLTVNEFYGKNDQLVSQSRVSASFATKISREQCKPEASFSAIFAVGDKGYVVDKDGVETSKYRVKGIVPRFNGSVDVVEFYAINPNVVSAVSSYWEKGDTVKANGKLNFTSTTETVQTPVDFGEPIETTRTISVSEFIITGGSQAPIEGEMAMDGNDIQAALTARQEYLTQLKAKKDSKATAAPATATAASFKDFNLGF